MNRRRGRIAAAALLAATLLAGCAPVAQNGDTVSLPAVVPAPVSIEPGSGAPFRLTSDTTVTGDTDAAATLAAIVEARTGLTPAEGGTESDISLRIEAGSGAAEA